MNQRVRSWPPIIAWANGYQFGAGQRVVQKCRQSRLLLWCRQGSGTVKTGRHIHHLVPDRWLLLAWGTSMTYQADARSPFLLGGVHWIPHCHPREPFTFGVAHDRQSALCDVASRRDAPLANWNTQGIEGDASRAAGLIHLAEYIVARFNEPARSVVVMRLLGRLLIEEVKRTIAQTPQLRGSERLERARRYVAMHLVERLDVSQLARAAGRSRATLARLFRREQHTSPAAWIGRLRAEQARALLRTTSLPVHEIARRVGVEDPYYFSRLFHRHTGVSPRQYRAAIGPL